MSTRLRLLQIEELMIIHKIIAPLFFTTGLFTHSFASERPNILFCIADDASFHHFSRANCCWVNTPNFDRVANEGLFFKNCYTPNAKSGPSRSCILTGLYSWQLGEAGNHICKFPADRQVFTEVLTDNGYNVAYTGKSWAPGDPGFKNGKPRLLTGTPYQKNKIKPLTKKISGNNYKENFKDFLDDQTEGKPWFFWFGSTEPHRAYEYGTGVSKGGKSINMIDRVPAFWPDNEIVRNDMLDYALEIEYYDSHIGMMLDELEKRGELDNTIIVVTSDNGMPFPRSKANNYEYSNHMPLAIMWRDGINNPGREVTDFVSFIDFAPTFLEWAGVDIEHTDMQEFAGASLNPIIKDKLSKREKGRRERVILGRERHDYGRPNNQGYPIRAIITDGMLYINNIKPALYPGGNPEVGYLDIDASPTKTTILEMNRQGTDHRFWDLCMGLRSGEELYDIQSDIYCMINLADNPRYADEKAKLKVELLRELEKTEDPRLGPDGDIFDRYKFEKENMWNFFERVQSGEIKDPWKQTRWVNPTDYEKN